MRIEAQSALVTGGGSGLAASIPFPKRLGRPDEFAALAVHAASSVHPNGETIRLDGALRMAPR
jgi:NAD(P)-dependent dehydrogenase (short-subunit alcohol dehydrogenase family)